MLYQECAKTFVISATSEQMHIKGHDDLMQIDYSTAIIPY